MGNRVVYTTPCGLGIVYWNVEYEEYCASIIPDLEISYHTDDLQDAIQTVNSMLIPVVELPLDSGFVNTELGFNPLQFLADSGSSFVYC